MEGLLLTKVTMKKDLKIDHFFSENLLQLATTEHAVEQSRQKLETRFGLK